MCTWRFILCFLGVLSSMFTKAVFIGLTISGHQEDFNVDESQLVTLFLCLLPQVIPNIILALFSIFLATGCNKKFFKVIFDFPGLWLLPAATYFSMGPKQIECCKSRNYAYQRRKLGFSKIATIINMTITIVMFGITFYLTNFSLNHAQSSYDIFGPLGLIFMTFLFPPILVFSIILNIIFMVLDTNCCCNRSQSCHPQCCCGPNCFKLKCEYINMYNDIEIWICDDDHV